jgi:hypothetical protein
MLKVLNVDFGIFKVFLLKKLAISLDKLDNLLYPKNETHP